jgi:hypothetical protein
LNQKYPELRRNLAANSQKMTTQFDVYATLKHVLDMHIQTNFNQTLSKTKQRGYSLLSKLPSARSCFEAQIPSHSNLKKNNNF